jgi:hypothetical protein
VNIDKLNERGMLESKDYVIRVENVGWIAYANDDAKFKALLRH